MTIEKLIKKYEGVLATLKENKALSQSNYKLLGIMGDDYPYDLDIKNTKEYIRDLKGIKG